MKGIAATLVSALFCCAALPTATASVPGGEFYATGIGVGQASESQFPFLCTRAGPVVLDMWGFNGAQASVHVEFSGATCWKELYFNCWSPATGGLSCYTDVDRGCSWGSWNCDYIEVYLRLDGDEFRMHWDTMEGTYYGEIKGNLWYE